MIDWTTGFLGFSMDGPALLAYLDPGTGSYVLQMVLAGLFGGLFALKQSWAGLKIRASAWTGRREVAGPHPSNAKRPAVHGRPKSGI